MHLWKIPDLKDLSDLIWKVFTPVNVLPGYERHWILMFEYSRGEKHCPAKLPHYQSFCPSLYLFESRLDTALYKWFPAKISFDIFYMKSFNLKVFLKFLFPWNDLYSSPYYLPNYSPPLVDVNKLGNYSVTPEFCSSLIFTRL